MLLDDDDSDEQMPFHWYEEPLKRVGQICMILSLVIYIQGDALPSSGYGGTMWCLRTGVHLAK